MGAGCRVGGRWEGEIVFATGGGAAKDGIGGGDGHEALGCCGVVRVVVWVVGFRKGVEGGFDFWDGGGWGQVEGLVVG